MNFTVKSFGLVLGSLTGMALFSSMSMAAAPTSGTNPCPGIYYQEPYNRSIVVPQGCPPNAMSAELGNQQQPVAEEQQPVLATIVPQMGKVSVLLKNGTNAPITYQVLGNTQQRRLAARAEIMLQALPVPATLTFLRPDGGLVRVVPIGNSEPGVLDLTLNGAMGLSDSQTTVRIQSSGKVNAY